MVEPSTNMASHIDGQTLLTPAIYAWEYYLKNTPRQIKTKPSTYRAYSPHTIKAFMADLWLLVEYFPPDRSLSSITKKDLENFIEWLEKGRSIPCSPKSLSRRITSLKSFFKWLKKATGKDPAEKILQQTVISPLPEVLTDEEVSAVLNTANQYRWDSKQDARPYTLLSLLLGTGIKKSECLGIHLNHIHLDAPEGPLVHIEYNKANPYKSRKIILPEDWADAYYEYLSQYNPVDQLFPWSPRRLEYLLEDIGKDANLDKHLSFAMCRWTSSLIDLANGLEPDKIRQKLGVSKIQWSEISDKLGQLSGIKSLRKRKNRT